MTFTANRITQEQYPASEPFTIRHNNHALTKIEAAANAGDLDALLALEPAGISPAGQQVHAEWRRAVLHLGGPEITRTRRETAPAPTPAPTPASDPDADLRRDAILHPMADASELEMARQGRAWYNGVLRPVDFDLIARMRTSTQATLAHLDQQQAWIEAGTDPNSILGSDWQVGSRNADIKDMGLQVVEQRRNRETSTLAGYERQHQRWQAANPLTVPPQQRGGLRVSALEQTGEPYDSHGIMYVPLKATVTIGTQTKQVTGIASSERIVIYDLIGRYPTGKPRKATVMIERATGRQDVYGGIGTGSSRSNNVMAIVGFEKIEPTPEPVAPAPAPEPIPAQQITIEQTNPITIERGRLDRRYTLEELTNPDTYANDGKLATFARAVATGIADATPDHRTGELKREFLAGQHAALMLAATEAVNDRQENARRKTQRNLTQAATLTPPAGYTVTTEGSDIVLSGAFNQDLHERIKRAGGRWDGAGGTNRRVWIIPASKSAGLQRIFTNSASALAEQQAAAARRAAEDATRRRQQEQEWQRQREAETARRETERAAVRSEREATPPARQARMLFPTAGLPPINRPIRMSGKAIVFTGTGQPFRINEDHPSVFGSHLLGHEGDMGRYCYYRPATDEETKQLEAKERQRTEAATQQAAKTQQLSAIKEKIQSGERPDGVHVPEGEVLHSTQNIYGAGDWFVIGAEWIWFVQNNGMDGDDWSRNNVRTGGAGGIGWRIPFDATIAEQLRTA